MASGASIEDAPDSSFDAPSIVLLLGESGSPTEADACIDLLTPGAPSTLDCLSVCIDKSPDEHAADWAAHVDDFPARLGVVYDATIGETTTIEAMFGSQTASDLTLQPIADPRDLTRLGMAISRVLETLTVDGRQVVGCLDSASVLLKAVEVDRVFRFLHILGRRLGSANAIFHIHLDPAAVDEQTVHTLRHIADRVVEIEGES